MDIQIVRSKSRMTAEGTPGSLDSGMGFTCDTLELEWNNNAPDTSCIMPAPEDPPETYNASIVMSPHLGREVIRLEDKNGRTGIEIHNGNFAGEAPGDISQVLGCTEVGKGYGQITRPVDGAVTQFGIMNSVVTLTALIEHIKANVPDNAFTVTYSWA